MAIVDVAYEKWKKDFEAECPGIFKEGFLSAPETALRRDLMRTAYMAGKKAARQPVGEPVEMSPEFTDTARAAIAWVLWHHQGGSSPVGQPLRFALGMGQHDRMTDQQIAEAKRFAAWANATTEDFHQRAPAQAVDLGGNEGYGTRYVPPVQAFDPGQFRESVERLKDDALHERDPGTAVNAYNRVLALIDGKAVQS